MEKIGHGGHGVMPNANHTGKTFSTAIGDIPGVRIHRVRKRAGYNIALYNEENLSSPTLKLPLPIVSWNYRKC